MTRNNTVNLQRQPRKVAVRLFVTIGPASFFSTALTVFAFSASPERRWAEIKGYINFTTSGQSNLT